MSTDTTERILNIFNSLTEETNALNEDEVVRLFEYLTDKNTNKSDVEKFLMSCPSNNAKLSYLRAISKKSESEQPTAETTTNTGLVHVYVDHSNVVIEGKRTVGAIEHIYDKNNKTYYMSQFGIDFGCLLTVIQRNRQLGSNPVMVGSRPPPNDSIWKKIEDQGYEVKVYDRKKFRGDDGKIHTREKCVDTEIAVTMVIDTLIKIKNPGILILVTGDKDFEPALIPIMEAGWKIEVRFWINSISRDLKELKVGKNAVRFIPLDPEYKSFSFGFGLEPTNKKKILDVFHKNNLILENKDLIDCYNGLQSSFCWWHRVDNENFIMYFKTDADLVLAERWLEKNLKDIQVWRRS